MAEDFYSPVSNAILIKANELALKYHNTSILFARIYLFNFLKLF